MASSDRSQMLARRAARVTAGGVTAGGRYDAALGRAPYFVRGSGARLWDVDGVEYIDFTASQGAAILGHGDPEIATAVRQGLDLGGLCTIETEHHVTLAERLAGVAGHDRVRFTVSGTEATMAAIRVARGVTRRDLVLKFDGHFHGMHESVFFNASAPDRPWVAPGTGKADSDGLPDPLAQLVVVAPFNDPAALIATLDQFADRLACVIVEPVAFNMGCVPAERDWLRLLREETARRGVVLIFDEVLSGFRERFGGALHYFDVRPDVATWAKALGAGWPIAAVTGDAWVMDALNPTGHVVVSGTYTGQLCAVMAAHAALDAMSRPHFHERLNGVAERFCDGLHALASDAGVPLRVQRFGSAFGLYFGLDAPVVDYRAARRSDAGLMARFTAASREAGLYFHLFQGRVVPMHYRVTAAHTTADIDEALDRLGPVFGSLTRARTPS